MYRRIQPSRRAKRIAPSFAKFSLLPVELQLLIWSYLLPPPAVHELTGDDKHLLGFKAANPNPVLLRVCSASRAFALKHYTLMFGTKSEVFKIGHLFEDFRYPKYSNPAWRQYYNTRVTELTPGIENHLVNSFDDPHLYRPQRGLQLLHPARNYVDLKRDSVYINDRTMRQEDMHSMVYDLHELQKHILLEDASKIQHLALDYIIWHNCDDTEEAESTLKCWFKTNGPFGFEERFELLTEYCGFRNLETLTLVVSIFHFTEPFSSRTWLILVADLRPHLRRH